MTIHDKKYLLEYEGVNSAMLGTEIVYTSDNFGTLEFDVLENRYRILDHKYRSRTNPPGQFTVAVKDGVFSINGQSTPFNYDCEGHTFMEKTRQFVDKQRAAAQR